MITGGYPRRYGQNKTRGNPYTYEERKYRRGDTPGLECQQPSNEMPPLSDMPPLSQNLPSINHPVTEPMRTRYGRVVKKPIRFQD